MTRGYCRQNEVVVIKQTDKGSLSWDNGLSLNPAISGTPSCHSSYVWTLGVSESSAINYYTNARLLPLSIKCPTFLLRWA